MKKHSIYYIAIFVFVLPSINLNAQDAETYHKRCKAVMNGMGEDGICLIYGLNKDNKLNPNFYYLTGLKDTSAILILCPASNIKTILFTEEEHWAVTDQNENSAVYPISDFRSRSFGLISEASKLWVSFNDLGRIKDLGFLYHFKKEISNSEHLFYKLREIKDEEEQKKLAKAIDITAATLNEVFVLLKDGMIENDILSMIDEKQITKGAGCTSFMQAGSGVNGTQVHAEPSDKIIRDGELIVFDVGAYYENYTSDISRTVPVNGKFSEAQKQIYAIVLAAQKAAIEKMLPGVGIQEVKEVAQNKLIDGLFKLGLITDKESPWQRSLYLVHEYSHFIGLDIHDYWSFMVRELKEKKYQPGMILTMEPGLYFPADLLDKKPHHAKDPSDEEFAAYVEKTKAVFEKYVNIGVRIEDDILITNEGNRILSASVPKEIEDIEKLMKAK